MSPEATQQLVNALAQREGRGEAADVLARAIGAEALLILVRDPDAGTPRPAPGFRRTLPGGPTWRAFLAACAQPGAFAMEVDYPNRQSQRTARAYTSEDGSTVAFIGGAPRLSAAELADRLLPITKLLQCECDVMAAQGAAAAAALATQQTSAMAASLEEARRRLADQAVQLQGALSHADQLNRTLTDLTHTLEQRVEAALAERRLLADLVENTHALVMVADQDYRWLAVNRAAADAFEQRYGRRPEIGLSMLDLVTPEHQAHLRSMWGRALAGEEFTVVEAFEDPACGRRHCEIKFNTLRNKHGRLIGAYQFVYDVTERLEAQARLTEAQDALRQSQKLEAVGQLTGGIAHDFNNLLTVIIGGLEQIERGLSGVGDPTLAARLRRSRDMATQAGQRAATLTARLLAFARRQPLAPKPLDANRLIAGLTDMLARTLGEEVRLEVVTAPSLWTSQADVNELENAILNLAVNARDAMPDGGRLTIETSNTFLDEDYVLSIPEPVAPGQYVMIAVSDSGLGMDAATVERAFEPFFTTKGVGQGTGLGLSQVYGFIRQSNGHVRIYSEAGHGTTVKLYLPRLIEAECPIIDAPQPIGSLRGDETVLVVEDHDDLRSYSVGVLNELGYRVLEASDGPTALRVLEGAGQVDLLFTDVVLPNGMDGRRLAEAARRLRPHLKVLFTTGYSRNAIVHNGRLDPGVHLVPKPFTFEALALKVRAVLERSAADA